MLGHSDGAVYSPCRKHPLLIDLAPGQIKKRQRFMGWATCAKAKASPSASTAKALSSLVERLRERRHAVQELPLTTVGVTRDDEASSPTEMLSENWTDSHRHAAPS
jgi:hypothetical protein